MIILSISFGNDNYMDDNANLVFDKDKNSNQYLNFLLFCGNVHLDRIEVDNCCCGVKNNPYLNLDICENKLHFYDVNHLHRYFAYNRYHNSIIIDDDMIELILVYEIFHDFKNIL